MKRQPRVHYDYGWRFRRDWVRDGIRWFIFPGNKFRARLRRYNQAKLRYVRARLAGTPKSAYLRHILDRILPAGGDEQQQVEAVVRFVQDATWHNPLECPFEANEGTMVTEAHELLELHDARCWHAGEVLRQLLQAAGWAARINVLPSRAAASFQVVTEVRYGGEWHVTDANYFKSHVILRRPDGSLPTLAWLRERPHYPDRFPGGWIFPAEYLTNAAGRPVTGPVSLPFPEAEDTWGADSYYCYYLGAEERFPPIRPPRLRARRVGRDAARLTWRRSRSRTSDFVHYDAEVRRERDQALVAAARGIQAARITFEGLAADEPLRASVRATDEHLLVEPETWYPASTIVFRLDELGLEGKERPR